jgi:hypothetical protein
MRHHLHMDASHQTVRLAKGRHASAQFGACVMELASMLADEPFSDRPGNASRVIGAFLRTYNDGIDDERRQDLYPLASLIVGTAHGRGLEEERACRCLVFARSLGAPPPGGRSAVAVATPEFSGSWAALAALRTGPSDDGHRAALDVVRELAAMRGRRRWRWLEPEFGRDPGRAVEDALAEPSPELAARR